MGILNVVVVVLFTLAIVSICSYIARVNNAEEEAITIFSFPVRVVVLPFAAIFFLCIGGRFIWSKKRKRICFATPKVYKKLKAEGKIRRFVCYDENDR